jgi:hypothetical protein
MLEKELLKAWQGLNQRIDQTLGLETLNLRAIVVWIRAVEEPIRTQ